MPFGGGRRKCIGDQFALFESVVALSMLQRRFTFELDPTAPPVAMTTGATIHTTEGLNVKLRVRAHADVSMDVNMSSDEDVINDEHDVITKKSVVRNEVEAVVHNGASMSPMHTLTSPEEQKEEGDAVSPTR